MNGKNGGKEEECSLVLYDHWASSSAWRVRIALAIKGLLPGRDYAAVHCPMAGWAADPPQVRRPSGAHARTRTHVCTSCMHPGLRTPPRAGYV